MPPEAERIWNRACEAPAAAKLPGDRVLAAMLAFDALANNGGVLHALECLTAATYRRNTGAMSEIRTLSRRHTP